MSLSAGEPGGGIDFVMGGFLCTLGWSPKGVREFRFGRGRRAGKEPDAATGSTGPRGRGRRLRSGRIPGCPPFVVAALRLLERYFSGSPVDFSSVPLDLGSIDGFSRRVYREVWKIPYGGTASYEDIARRAGSRGASRAVGMCMKKNPLPLFIPCHRVIRKTGAPGGFSSPGGAGMKIKLLRAEGVMIILLAACLLCGACCGARGGTCGAATAADRPWRAEFTFSNLCDEKIVAEKIEVTVGDTGLLYPPAGEEAPQGVPFGQDAPLGEAYFIPGRYTLAFSIRLDGEGAAAAPLEGSREFSVEAEPIAVEVTLRKQEGGCGVLVDVTGSGSGGNRCYEPPPETKPASPPCEK